MKNDLKHNASGAVDLTAYEAIQRADENRSGKQRAADSYQDSYRRNKEEQRC